MKGKIKNFSMRYKRSLRIRNTAIAVMLAAGLVMSGVAGGESRLQISHAQEAEQIENSIDETASENNTLDDTIDEESKEAVADKEETTDNADKDSVKDEAEANSAAGSGSSVEEDEESSEKSVEPKVVSNSGNSSTENTAAAENTATVENTAAAENTATVENTSESTASNTSSTGDTTKRSEAGASDTASTGDTSVSPAAETPAATSAEASDEKKPADDKQKEFAEKAVEIKAEAESGNESADDIEDGYEMADPSDSYDATKPTVKLESMSYIKLYDGKPLVDDMQVLLVEEGWLDGDGATYTFTESQTEIGSIPNKFKVTLNPGTPEGKYNIIVKYGELRVVENLDEQQYILSIAGKSESVKYDGKEHTLQGFVLSGRGNNEYRVEGSGDPAESLSFNIGDATYYVSGVKASGSGTNAGDYVVDISGSPVVKDASGNDVTKDFKFEYLPGTLTIEKRNITLKSAGAKKEFDGEDLTAHEVKVSGDGFVDGEGATYKFTGKQKEVGESFNYFTCVMDDGTLESNYSIKKVYGKLTVKEAKDSGGENSTENNSSNENSGSGESSESSESSSSSESGNSANAASSASSDNAGEGVSAGNANTNPGGPAVLGAKKGREETTDSKKDAPAVLGARKAATDDTSADNAMRVLIMLLSAITVIYITGKNKRKSNG